MECQSLLSQALAWLDNMHIPYSDDCPPDFWSFEYKGLDIHLPKDCEYNELGLYGMDFIQPELMIRMSPPINSFLTSRSSLPRILS